MRTLILLALVAPACSDYDLQTKGEEDGDAFSDGEGDTDADTDDLPADSACSPSAFPVETVPLTDTCSGYAIGDFRPTVEWDVPGESSTALPVVADLDGDGMPEVVVNWSWVMGTGTLAVYAGDGSGEIWRDEDAQLGSSVHVAVADLDDDGSPEIVGVRQYSDSELNFWYTVVAWSADGQRLWESGEYHDDEFDYATGVAISDMDHDGSPEIVAGRVVLHADGTERGVGRYGRGASTGAEWFMMEGTHPAIADLDLDGIEEVVTGNAIYDPDGGTIWRGTGSDGAVGIANLDADPEGEFVTTFGNTVTARDTDGTELWSLVSRAASIFPVPSVADVDNDGEAEIVVAGGDELWVLNADGSLLWTAFVHDMTGATGASMFDFDADGVLEVVYIDEVQMVAYNGTDGVVKFQTDEHASATMYDYPTIADVDADGHAEILVAHDIAYGIGLSVYGDRTNSWAPARKLWNQHAYTITNINDDLSVPTTATQNFTTYNNFHAAQALAPGESLQDELEAEILEVCEDDCDEGVLWVTARGRNAGLQDVPAGVSLALYAMTDDGRVLLDTAQTTTDTPSGSTTEAVVFRVDPAAVAGATGLYLVVDDDGTGTGAVSECVEDNNEWLESGSFCD